MKLFASAELTTSPGGSLLVPVRFGTQDVWMVLHMSSGLALIAPAAVAHLGLEPRRLSTTANLFSNGERIQREVVANSLLVGNANFTDWILYVMPGDARPLPQWRGKPVVGTLSARFMNVVDMELDLEHGRMNLFQQATCGGGQVYWTRTFTSEKLHKDPSGLMFFALDVDNRRVEASFNTQGAHTRLSEVIARQFFDFRRESGNLPPVGQVVGEFEVALTDRALSIPAVTVSVYNDRGRGCEPQRLGPQSSAIGFRNCFGTAPFEIGTDLLKRMRIYVASKEERIYFTPNAPTPAGSGAASGAGR